MNHAGTVFLLMKHLIQKIVARGALRAEHVALAEAGVDQQADGDRKIVFEHEIFNVLRMVVFGENKIVLAEVLDELALLVADRGGHVDDFHDAGEIRLRRSRIRWRLILRGRNRRSKEGNQHHGEQHAERKSAAAARGHAAAWNPRSTVISNEN